MGSRREKKAIVFVCKGNIHRSAIAEQVFRRILNAHGLDNRFRVLSRGIQGSAGTKPTTHKNITKYKEWEAAKPSLEEFGIDITRHEAKPITKSVASRAAVIIAFDRIILEEDEVALLRQFPQLKGKIHLLSELDGNMEDVQDCQGKQDSVFQAVTKRIHDTLTNHWEKLIGWTG